MNAIITGIKDAILAVYSSGASVFLPVIFILVGLFFRMKFADALRAGLRAGIGIAGVGLVTNYMITTLGPVTEYYAAKGSGFTIVDIPWSVSAALPFALPFAVFLIPAFAILSLLLVKFKVFKTLQVNIWDYGIPLVVSGFAYVMFDSLVIAVICAFANFIWGIWLGDLFAKKWSGALGMEGTTTSNTTHMSLAGPVCWGINKILDHIPGINKISITPKTIQKKLGIIGEPAVIGLIVGMFMGLITGQNLTTICAIGMGISGSMMLIPQVLKIFLEGLGMITQAAQKWAVKHIGEDAECYIACDMAMSIGSPVVITINSIMLPIAVAFALIVPGFSYFPTGLMGGIIYMVGFCTMYCKEDFLRSLLCSAVYVCFIMALMNYLAPEIGSVYKFLDPSLAGDVTSGPALDWFTIIMCGIKRFFLGA